eukprot:m.159420 g.159420  ORF g.159420 m.159420 type:complete len:59 (-) comp11790_c0_seq1:2335-2511(-)
MHMSGWSHYVQRELVEQKREQHDEAPLVPPEVERDDAAGQKVWSADVQNAVYGDGPLE